MLVAAAAQRTGGSLFTALMADPPAPVGVARLIPAGSVRSWNCAKGEVPSAMTFAP